MRVITGSARGMTLKTLEGISTRPTTDRVKEAVFSAIQFDIEGRRVLDLFAGSGQMGIEAMSRGALTASFVDKDKGAVAVIKENLEKTGFASSCSVFQMDYSSFLTMNTQMFDLVFLDPPYESDMLLKALDSLGVFVPSGGTAVCEHPASAQMPDEISGFSKYRSYKYGKTSVTIYRKD